MKNKIVAGLLAFFLGWAGIHRFYLGDIGKGIAYALFFWTGIPFIIGFIDFIVFLAMDGQHNLTERGVVFCLRCWYSKASRMGKTFCLRFRHRAKNCVVWCGVVW